MQTHHEPYRNISADNPPGGPGTQCQWPNVWDFTFSYGPLCRSFPVVPAWALYIYIYILSLSLPVSLTLLESQPPFHLFIEPTTAHPLHGVVSHPFSSFCRAHHAPVPRLHRGPHPQLLRPSSSGPGMTRSTPPDQPQKTCLGTGCGSKLASLICFFQGHL